MEYFQSRLDQALVPACRPLPFLYLALYGNKGLSVTTDSVILDLEMGQKSLCYVFASAWPAVWLCLKIGSGKMVLMRLLQIGAKYLRVLYS